MTWLRIIAVVLVGLAASLPAHARIQRQMFCWDPDVEFPVACVEEEDDEEDDEDEPGQAPADRTVESRSGL
jgi:hypothetical protein